jgi:hypothetical protein
MTDVTIPDVLGAERGRPQCAIGGRIVTRLDLLTVASGAIAGLTGYLVWRNRDKAAAFAEALGPRMDVTTPADVERAITNLRRRP